MPDAVELTGALGAPGTEAAERPPEVGPAPRLPSLWQPLGIEIGVAVTAGMGVVVATVGARPGEAG